MMTYSKASQKSIQAAISKARQVKPRVTVISYGKFEVCGSKGDCYTVQFTADSAGGLVVICGCKGSLNGRPCYHGAASAGAYKLQWTAKREEAAAAASSPCQDCDRSLDSCVCGSSVAQSVEDLIASEAVEVCGWYRGCENVSEAGGRYCGAHTLVLAAAKNELFG